MDSLTFQRNRIPTLLGIGGVLLLLVVLTVVNRNIQAVRKLFSFAAAEVSPASEVGVVNVTDGSFAVYWLTESPTGGAVFYGKTADLGDGVAVDDRDLSAPAGKYITHFVRVSGLSAGTKYYFKVGASNPSFGDPGSGSPYTVTTGPKLGSGIAPPPITGKVFGASGDPAKGAIAVWEAASAQKIGTLVSDEGSYVLPTGLARSPDLTKIAVLPPGATETIKIDLGSLGQATINCTSGSDRPLPDVKLGQTVVCPGNGGEAASLATPSAHFRPKTATTFSGSGGSLQVNITSGQTVGTNLPTISGKAGAKQIVRITIHSDVSYSGTVIADPSGAWSWTPPAGLSPGQHTVTITVVNADGTTQTVTRDFSVSLGAPILPITSGTPSAQPTVTPTLQVTAAPTPISEATSSGMPVTGSEDMSRMLLTLGLGLATLSMVVLWRIVL